MNEFTLSPLGHTWVLDLDGTVLKHNGYKTDGEDSFLPGAEAFLRSLPEKDMVVFLTSREEGYREQTLRFLDAHGIRYAAVVFGVPYGERILGLKKHGALHLHGSTVRYVYPYYRVKELGK